MFDPGSSPFASPSSQADIELATGHRLLAIYPYPYFVRDGGLACYGPGVIDQYRVRPATSIASSGEKNRPACRCRRRPSTNW